MGDPVMAGRRIAQGATNDPALSAALKQSREKLQLLNVEQRLPDAIELSIVGVLD
jgi:hypothetical protein